MSTKPAVIANDLMDSCVRRIHELEERCERLTAEVEMMRPLCNQLLACAAYEGDWRGVLILQAQLIDMVDDYRRAKEAQRGQ